VRLLQARLVGVDAELGRVAAADVARVVLGLERAMAQAAYLVLARRRRGTTGRHLLAVERAARLRYVGLEIGSLVQVLALPDDADPVEGELPLRVVDLSERALDRIFDTVEGRGSVSAGVAGAVAQLAAEVGIGDRHTALELAGPTRAGPDGEPAGTRQVILDGAVRRRLHGLGTSPPDDPRDETLVGVLVEADFEHNTARLRLPTEVAVEVTFPAELADVVQEALRERSRVDGIVSYDPRTAQARAVELHSVVRGLQLTLVGEDPHRATSPE
jgi:hypothetical protein